MEEMRKSTPPQQSQIARKVQESHPLAGRLLFLLLTFTITVLVFVGAKAAFMLACGSDRTLSGNDGVAVAIHGLSLDLSTALYFLILPFLLSLLTLWWQHQMLCRLLRAYFALIAILFSLAFVADTSLYPFWGFKLDASCLQYLETPTEAMASVTPAFIALRVVVFVIAAAVIVLLYLPCGLLAFPGQRGCLCQTGLF